MQLNELNVINVDDIEKYAKQFTDKIEYAPAKAWFLSSLRRFLINDETVNTRISKVSDTAPEWLKKKYEEKVPLFRFSATDALTNQLNHIVDWLNSVYQKSVEEIAPNAPKLQLRQQIKYLGAKILKSLNQIDLKKLLEPRAGTAAHHVDDWFEMLNKLVVTQEKEKVGGVEVLYKTSDGLIWVNLTSKEALEQEGKEMGHCVGGYYRKVHDGRVKILSLRDRDSDPHATIELENPNENGGYINQIKGKGNRPPVAKYVPAIKEFLNTLKAPPRGGKHDVESMGLRYNESTKQYGTLKEIATVMYKFDNGFEVITIPDNTSGYRSEFYLWGDDSKLATISDYYGNSFNISITGADDEKESALYDKLYAMCVEFMNNTFDKFDIARSEREGYYKVSEDSKYINLKDLKPVYKFTDTMNVYKVVDSGERYIFVDTDDMKQAKFNISSSGISNIPQEVLNKTNETKFVEAVKDFMNEVKLVPVSPSTFFDNLNLLYEDGEFKDAVDVMKEVKDFGTAKLLVYTPKAPDENYRSYYNNRLVPEFRLYSGKDKLLKYTQGAGKQIQNVKIYQPVATRKYNAQLVEYFNEANLTSNGKFAEDELKIIGIVRKIVKGEKVWGLIKQKTTESGWNIEKVSTKQANIIDETGEKVGEIGLDGANTIDRIKSTGVVDLSTVAKFLADYAAKNPKITFTRMAKDTALWDAGYFVYDHKLVTIKSVFPTEVVSEVDGFTWTKAARFFNGEYPERYQYGLRDANKKLKVYVHMENDNTVNEIKVYTESKEEDEVGKRVMMPFEEVNVAPYVKALAELFAKENLTANGAYLAKAGLKLKGHTLTLTEDDPRLKGFISGLIQYDNGFKWVRDRYTKSEWKLMAPEAYEYDRGILKCNITDEGIQDIHFINPAARKTPKLYRSYFNDLLDLVDEMNETD